jgi:hypothetical protein
MRMKLSVSGVSSSHRLLSLVSWTALCYTRQKQAIFSFRI